MCWQKNSITYPFFRTMCFYCVLTRLMEHRTVAEAANDPSSEMYQPARAQVTDQSHQVSLLSLVIKTTLEQILPPDEMRNLENNLELIQKKESARKYYKTHRT